MALWLALAALLAGSPSSAPRALVGGTLVDGTGAAPVPNATVVVKLGVTVCWYNVGVMSHTVTGGPWGTSPTLGRAEEFMWTANQVGTFGYRCSFHNPQMQSILQVVP